jgi:hypothetical protein
VAWLGRWQLQETIKKQLPNLPRHKEIRNFLRPGPGPPARSPRGAGGCCARQAWVPRLGGAREPLGEVPAARDNSALPFAVLRTRHKGWGTGRKSGLRLFFFSPPERNLLKLVKSLLYCQLKLSVVFSILQKHELLDICFFRK